MLDLLLEAIVKDDIPGVKGLIARDPSLTTAGTVEQRLFDTDFIHWLYKSDTALHLAAAGHRDAIAELLLENGADPNACLNHRRGRPLHYAADGIPNLSSFNSSKQIRTIEVLLASGAEIDAQDRNGATALHRAVRARCADAVRVLLERGCNPVLRNNSGSTPFHLAVQNTGRGGTGSDEAVEGQRQIIETFLRNGISPLICDGKGKSVIDSARAGWIREMLTHGCDGA